MNHPESLNEQFAIPGILHFEEQHGLLCAQVHSPAATGTVFLHGAHVTAWQPAGEAPVLFLSSRSSFAPGKPIRGGIPVIFPWFGPDGENRDAGKPAPMHGFARTSEWTVAFALLVGEEVHLTLALQPSETSRAFGFDRFRAVLELRFGRELSLALTVGNEGDTPLRFEEAFHTYFAVGDVREVEIAGLDGVEFLDKVDAMQTKRQEGPLRLTGRTDRVYLDTDSTCVGIDPAGGRRLIVRKAGSDSTVVWNPWDEIVKTLPDMDPEAWPGMLCVETCNVARNAVTVAPGATHTMRTTISVERLSEGAAQ